MEAFFFGNSKEPLYGVYHSPQVAAPLDEGIVICVPFGQEYMRSHRAVRQLAMLLAKQGFHVLRFDYRGTGDSSGEIENVSPTLWLADIATAVEELKEMTGVDKISLVGLRLGALMAANATNSVVHTHSLNSQTINHLVMWDPLISGKAYLDELHAKIAATSTPGCNYIDSDNTLHFNGYPLGKAFQEGLKKLDLLDSFPNVQGGVYQIISHKAAEFSAIRDAWRHHPQFRHQHIEAPSDWSYVDNYGGILLPQPIIQGVVNYFVAASNSADKVFSLAAMRIAENERKNHRMRYDAPR